MFLVLVVVLCLGLVFRKVFVIFERVSDVWVMMLCFCFFVFCLVGVFVSVVVV